ncbi:hypothetical protein [Cohaesibacter celericrescens]|uniref:Uncharacterized protein n=1 Tax=Cohaesibacter celericrescens TaxID=2067669 RepID=A0A2N5XKS4_9HYPH|nr:hypothetical protein [Cohaesibacter celericrescens]PLW75094.1 hypothetical protein C0081_22675 [Cohaesibacter celericrescens]
MIAKLFVLVAALGGIWLLVKMLGKIGQQNKEIQMRRQKEAQIKAQKHAEREADIIDLEQDPETGDFKEK